MSRMPQHPARSDKTRDLSAEKWSGRISIRNAVGTLRDIASTVKGPGLPGDGRTVKYYDVEASGWRSFKVGNIVTIY